MARPSRNQDRALIIAGRLLYPKVGAAGLTIRQVAEAAGVNIGMFHYHFKTREAFLQAVLQSIYEDMFERLPLPPVKAPMPEATATQLLRAGLVTLGGFVREHRSFLARLLADAANGDPVVRAFIGTNFPRHFDVVGAVIAAGQASGELRKMPVPQAIAFCAGAISLPLLAVGALIDVGALPKAGAKALESSVLSESAVEQRIDLVLVALANPDAATKVPRKNPKKARS